MNPYKQEPNELLIHFIEMSVFTLLFMFGLFFLPSYGSIQNLLDAIVPYHSNSYCSRQKPILQNIKTSSAKERLNSILVFSVETGNSQLQSPELYFPGSPGDNTLLETNENPIIYEKGSFDEIEGGAIDNYYVWLHLLSGSLYFFDIKTKQFDSKCTVTLKRKWGSAVTYGQSIIICGGIKSDELDKNCDVLDYFTGKITASLAPMKHPRLRPYLVNHNGKLYILGGRYSITGDYNDQSNTMEMYDNKKNHWVLLMARKSTPFYRFAAATVHNKHIYFCGGWVGGAGIAECQKFDLITNQWNAMANYNTAHRFSMTSFKNSLYSFGERYNGRSVYVYDEQNDNWKQLDSMVKSRYDTVAVPVEYEW